MPAQLRVLAGDCTTTEDTNARTRTYRGHVVILIKPDNTTLVHDRDGYQPVAWFTRPDTVTVETDGSGFSVTAREGDRTLGVVAHRAIGARSLPVTPAGQPVGACPTCDDVLIRTATNVECLGCGDCYGLPAGATVTDRTCEDCGLPKIRVERGEVFHLCLDVDCESLTDILTEKFDGQWACPNCNAALWVKRSAGRVFLGCSAFPECRTAFPVPQGRIVDDCPCGLPVFETTVGRRCLDESCYCDRPAGDDPDPDPDGET